MVCTRENSKFRTMVRAVIEIPHNLLVLSLEFQIVDLKHANPVTALGKALGYH